MLRGSILHNDDPPIRPERRKAGHSVGDWVPVSDCAGGLFEELHRVVGKRGRHGCETSDADAVSGRALPARGSIHDVRASPIERTVPGGGERLISSWPTDAQIGSLAGPAA